MVKGTNAMFKVLPLLGLLVTLVNAVPEVRVGRTTLLGKDSIPGAVEFYGGIPYAEPPLGPLRLRKPVLKTRLETRTFNASAHGESCTQRLGNPATSSAEDCLTINVYRPKGTKPTDKLPIIFWTYGGGFIAGGSVFYPGQYLVNRSIERGTPMIYVDFNYRLGPLGFPIGKEAETRRALNLGVHDHTAALEWVHANIHFFGGDKSKITVFGESAGAMLLGVQLLNPNFGKLVRGAIVQSGAATGPQASTATRNEPLWQDFVSKVPSCASVATSGATFECLQKAPTEEIVAGLTAAGPAGLIWAPTLDSGPGTVFPDYASRLYAKGHFARIPFIAGTTLDEGTSMANQQPVTTQDLQSSYVAQHSPALTTQEELEATVAKLLELYPEDPTVGSPYGTGNELFGLPPSYKRISSLNGDMSFQAPRRYWSQTGAKAGIKSYGYIFTQPQPVPRLGVLHASELPYIFGDTTDTNGFVVSIAMMDYWISFTVSQDPNDGKGSKRPHWPQYTTKNQVLLQLQQGNTTVIPDDYRKEQIEHIIKSAHILRR